MSLVGLCTCLAASVSIQEKLRWARSSTASPSVGSRVLDAKTSSEAPLNPTSPVKERKEGGTVEGKSDPISTLLPSSDKTRKGAVKKCLSPIEEADVSESEEGSSEGSSDEDLFDDECDQPSPAQKELGSGKRKSMGSFDGPENQRGANKKKSRGSLLGPKAASSSHKTSSRGAEEVNEAAACNQGADTRTKSAKTFSHKTSFRQTKEVSEAATCDQGADTRSRNAKKGRIPVLERVSMAKTTRGATTKPKP